MNLTGGLAWHWQAWCAQARWAPTVRRLEAWLHSQTNWPGASTSPTDLPAPLNAPRKLLLIGASAGWMMPNSWLRQFEEVHTFDIDPWAAPLFKWRHADALKKSGTTLTCHTQNAFAHFPQLLEAHPEACVFFDNVLGQIRFQTKEIDSVETNFERIRQSLQGRQWGSVHDRMSGPVQRYFGAPPQAPEKIDTDKQTQQWLMRMNAQSPWLDHLTQHVFPAQTAVENFAWAFKPGYWHWLQAGWVRP